MMDWIEWHESYQNSASTLSKRLEVVRQRIVEALDRSPAGPIRVASIRAGDGRDLLGVVPYHPRAGDILGRLVELDPRLAERARASAPAAIEVVCGDAGKSDSYEGIVPVNLLLCCGVFGNITEEDIRKTINCWPTLCAPGATVIWTRGSFEPDLRPQIRKWVTGAGFEELSFDGGNEKYGVGVARMVRTPEAYQREVHFFRFVPEKKGK